MPAPSHFATTRQGPRGRRWASLAAVAALHGAALWGLWQTEFRSTLVQAGTLFVSFIEPAPPVAQPPRAEPRRLTPAPTRHVAAPLLAAQAPVTAPSDYVAPAPPAPLAAVAVPEPAPAPPKPVSLPELAVACPERAPPAYPPFARRLGEQGQVVLRVFLDERGRVSEAVVNQSSGSPRLDAAALAAVRRWQCQPAMREGRAVPAVALQPFKFVLDRS